MVSNTDFMIGVAFVIGFAILLTILSKVEFFKGFIAFCLISSVFIFKAGFIELWLVILFLFLDMFVLVTTIKDKRKGVVA